MVPPIRRNLKRKRFNQPEEINFDSSARQEYLTGFHKRKLERAKHAQDIAIKKERENKLETRRQIRAERKAELARYVKSVDESIHKGEKTWEGGEDGASTADEWEGIDRNIPVDQEQDGSGDDQDTTFVVEEVEITRHGFRKSGQAAEEEENQHADSKDYSEQVKPEVKKKRIWTKEAPARSKPRKKKFTYETKSERQLTRSKQRASKAKARDRRKGK